MNITATFALTRISRLVALQTADAVPVMKNVLETPSSSIRVVMPRLLPQDGARPHQVMYLSVVEVVDEEGVEAEVLGKINFN